MEFVMVDQNRLDLLIFGQLTFCFQESIVFCENNQWLTDMVSKIEVNTKAKTCFPELDLLNENHF